MRCHIFLLLCMFFLQPAVAQAPEEYIAFNEEEGYFEIRYIGTDGNTLQETVLLTGNQSDPKVGASGQFDASSDIYIYAYEVENGPNAKQVLRTFAVEVLAPVSELTKPSDEWRSRFLSHDSLVKWSQTRGTKGLLAEAGADGFTFASEGLPSIVSGYAQSPTWLGYPDEGPIGEMLAVIDSVQETNRATKLRTIGPKEPPSPFDPRSFLETIRSYGEESLELGWIANRGILQSLQAKLDNAERQLERGNTRTAVNVLRAFVNEVEALPERQLSSEAYALLKYNAEYLIEQLEAQ